MILSTLARTATLASNVAYSESLSPSKDDLSSSDSVSRNGSPVSKDTLLRLPDRRSKDLPTERGRAASRVRPLANSSSGDSRNSQSWTAVPDSLALPADLLLPLAVLRSSV